MNENILIEGLRKQDKVIFDFVFNYYYSGLCAFPMRFLNDNEATEDLVQDFFVFLWSEGTRLQLNTSVKVSVISLNLAPKPAIGCKNNWNKFGLAHHKEFSVGISPEN